MAKTHIDIIQTKGASAIAIALGAKPATVRMWRLRKRIPRSVWPELIEAYPDLTVEQLKEAEAA